MTRRYKIILIAVIIGAIIDVYFTPIIYALYVVGVYPVKSQIKNVAVEFNSAWLPAGSNDSPIFNFLKRQATDHDTLFYKIEMMKPFTKEAMMISWLGDKYGDSSPIYDKDNKNYSSSIKFDWGTAFIVKKELVANSNSVVAVVPEYRISIQADTLDQSRVQI